jgi:type VI secretion system secreted protein VgrG
MPDIRNQKHMDAADDARDRNTRALTLSGAVLQSEDVPPLEALSLEGEEAINALYEYRLVVQTPERPAGMPPWTLDRQRLQGHEITVHLELEGAGTFIPGAVGNGGRAGVGAGTREISGVISAVQLLDSDARGRLKLELVLRPGLWEATLGRHQHPFHGKTVVEVLGEVLAHYPWLVDKRLIERYPELDRITQWGESDWDFCCRLMQQSGINYHFEHAGGTHRLVLSDHNAAFRPFGEDDGPYRRIPIHPPGHRIDREYIHTFTPTNQMVSTSWEGRDYDYTRPQQALLARQGQPPQETTHARAEVYQWRLSGDGAAGGLWSQPNAGRDPTAHTQSDVHGRWLSRIRHEELVQAAERGAGAGHIRAIVAGRTFHLEGHAEDRSNAEHIVLSARLSVQAPGQHSQAAGAPGHWRVHTQFVTQPARIALRPALTLAKPRAHGPEPGIVVGPVEGQVHTDHLARVKVWQPSQRRDPREPGASIWMRVLQTWAGNQQGALFLPRVGQEVMLGFEGGDPDRPIVLGSVHNAMNLPGWQQPGQHTIVGIRSRELGDGRGNSAMGRSNHLALDDTPGHIQAQLKSDHQHSSISLGDIYRIEDREGRKDARGQGAEVRTDGHGVMRAALGLLLSTHACLAAQGGMKDMAEALQQMQHALDAQEQMAYAAQQHNAQDEHDQHATGQALQTQHDQIRGDGQPLAELSAPHLVIDSAAGLQTTAAASTLQTSGGHHAIVSGLNTGVTAGASVLLSAINAIRLFARQAGVRIVAAVKNIEMQAQAGDIDLQARETLRLRARRIVLEASEFVLINGDGSHTRWEGDGIRHATAGAWNVHAQHRNYSGPQTLPVPPLRFPASACVECLARAARQGSAFAQWK